MHFEAIADLAVKSGCSEKLKIWFREILPDTRSYEGCISVRVIQNQRDPNRMMLIGQWTSREKWEKYISWRQERGDIAILESFVEGEVNLECFDCFVELRNPT